MYHLGHELPLEIDTMGRFFDAEQNFLRLPDDADDDVWAGDYFPRVFFGAGISIEYLSVYNDAVSDSTLVVVCGIYEDSVEAAKALHVVQQQAPKAYLLPTEIYMGCMH